MQLALFDLDFTLIDFDSGLAWMEHLEERGRAAPGAHARHLAVCRAFVAGTAGVRDVHRSSIAPLVGLQPAAVQPWTNDFARAVAGRLPAGSLELVNRHQARGDLCAIVTATSHLIAAALARGFGIEHLLATRSEALAQGITGRVDGLPCWREHKIVHVRRWLDARGQSLAGFERSWFYSDSASDLPLLQAVTDPVAVGPDERLRSLAGARGWARMERPGGGGHATA